MTNVLHLHDRYGLDPHRNSIMASLSHRLAVARADNNSSLVALLEQEKQQVIDPTAHAARSHRNWWKAATCYLQNMFFGGTALQVSEVVDGRDRWWVASDPQTGRFVYADSEAELRLWIEENYQESK